MLGLLGFANLVPVLGSIFMSLVFMGVVLDVVRQVLNKETPTIPTLDIGRQFNEGLKFFVVNLFYAIPAIVLGLILAIVGVATGVFAYNGNDVGLTAGLIVTIILLVCLGTFFVIYSILLAIITPEIYARFAKNSDIKEAIQFKEVFKTVFKKPAPYLLSFLGVLLLGIVGGIASSILTSIGAIALLVGSLFGMAVAMAYIMLGSAHFYGQAHNVATEELL
jgi:hypothetical protein